MYQCSIPKRWEMIPEANYAATTERGPPRHLMRMAGRFSRRIHGYAKAERIPLVHCQAGERKHELAEEYLAKPQITQGLFLMVCVTRSRTVMRAFSFWVAFFSA